MDKQSMWKAAAIVLAVTFLLVATGWPFGGDTRLGLAADPAPTATPKDGATPTPKPSDPTPTPKPPTPTPTARFGGCTPGFWKNNTQAWGPTGYAPGATLGSVFTFPAGFSSFGSATFLQALGYGGGAGLDGAARIMLRAAVAALLNAAHPGVSYAYSTSQIVGAVNTALASNSRETILTLATNLDTANNQGCPLSAAFSR
ncbi:MAG: hypothetical protein QN147_04030 [Armatimonadota bacterium]|nr:hypothetical protein [Armatimonadota bacterium]